MLACAYRDLKVKAFVASCGTTILEKYKDIKESDRSVTSIERPSVIDEYETHKSSVDIANNRRDNLDSYHNIISTDRWEMKFLGFILGICEANAFSCYKVFANECDKIKHGQFKDVMAYQLLLHCKDLVSNEIVPTPEPTRNNGTPNVHSYQSLPNEYHAKRKKLVCKPCHLKGKSRTRVEKCCSCDTNTPLCKDCFNSHLKEADTETSNSYYA